jgi:pyridoxal phosphate enzyme (YggS family)
MASGLTAVRERVAAAAQRVGRAPDEVTIVAVSKEASDDQIATLVAEGVRDFGENRAEGLEARAANFGDSAIWHFIGRLQGNKVSRVRPITHLLHSLDRFDLADYWVKGPGLPPPVLIQVNVAGETQKAGFAPDETHRAVEHAVDRGLDVRGLMTMAPLTADPESSRPVFAGLRSMRDELARVFPFVKELSMGMSDDFEVAVEEGATILRVGRAIFHATRD